MTSKPCAILDLPDSILLKIFSHLSFGDLQSISKVDRRLYNIRHDRTLVCNTDLNGYYWMTDEEWKDYMLACGSSIQSLTLSNSYWFTSRNIILALRCCRSLKELDLSYCNITVENLVSALVHIPDLESLSFGVSSFECLQKKVYHPARKVLAQLKKLSIVHYSRQRKDIQYLGEHPTILDYCKALEELFIDAIDMSIPELYRPILSSSVTLPLLRYARLTSTIHAGAQMLFYGVLTQLPESRDTMWQSLIMPNVNFTELLRKPQGRAILDGVHELRELDVSGSRDDFMERSVENPGLGERKTLDFIKAVEMRYLNVAQTRMGCRHLLDLTSAAQRNLTSINLFGCERIFQGEDDLDASGLVALFDQCKSLRHVNLGGAHIHVMHNDNCQPQTRHCNARYETICHIKGMKSLCLPTCCIKDRRVPSMSCTGYVPPPQLLNNRAKRPRLDQPGRNQSRNIYTECDLGEDEGLPPSLCRVIVDQNPDLMTLEIIPSGFVSSFHKNFFICSNESNNCHKAECIEGKFISDQNLSQIGKLQHLTSLTLVGCRALNGSCLVEIARGCKNLERLSLANLGNALMAGGGIVQALPHFTSLCDLRLDQATMSLGRQFFSSLTTVLSLERLCIIARHSSFEPSDLLKAVMELKKLIVVQTFTDATLTSCRILKSSLIKRFRSTRPAFHAAIHTLADSGIREASAGIPSNHLRELTMFSSKVSFLPPRIEFLGDSEA